ncbi:MAG: peroxide stress protein YaaA [Phenylobacterium sp.]|uniref:peroxide stress protein YaaA n=1 Tax=Phenylobacterium sp. TaxID=1871053 RepID=UPI003BB4E948
MLIVLSPAKAMNFAAPDKPLPMTTPQMGEDIALLSETTRKLTVAQVKRLMSLSDNLAKLNRERFQAFDPSMEEGLQAAFAFNGDVYMGFKARELDKKALAFAQDHVRILSGLYGLLRPLDGIQPYRLEMGTRLKTRRGPSLYAFWGDKVALALNEQSAGHRDPTLVNCASQEYFGVVDMKALKLPIVNVRFVEEKDGESRVISFFAKRARGALARYAVDHRITKAADLKAFDTDGYKFQPQASSEAEWVFARPQPPLVKAKAKVAADA